MFAKLVLYTLVLFSTLAHLVLLVISYIFGSCDILALFQYFCGSPHVRDGCSPSWCHPEMNSQFGSWKKPRRERAAGGGANKKSISPTTRRLNSSRNPKNSRRNPKKSRRNPRKSGKKSKKHKEEIQRDSQGNPNRSSKGS